MHRFLKSLFARFFCILIIGYQHPAFAQCPSNRTNQTIYISPTGSNSGAGTEAAPYLTLSYATWEVGYRRDLNCATLPDKIVIKAGDYFLSDPIYIDSRVNGTSSTPFVIEAEPGANLIGGIKITNAARTTSGGVFSRIPIAGQGSVYKALLSPYGISNVGSLDTYAGCSGGGCNTTKYLDVYLNRAPLSIARYPSKTNGGSDDWISVTNVPTQNGNQIIYSDSNVGSRVSASGAWIAGHLRAEWIYSISKITSANTSTKTLTLDSSTLSGGARGPFPQARFALVDAPEFLDYPGEYYLSQSEQALYFIPPAGVDMSSAEIIIPTVSRLLTVTGAQNIILKNISSIISRDLNLNVYNSSNIQIIGGVFKGAGEQCTAVTHSSNVNIYGATISQCGFGAAFLTGGNITTLTKGNNSIANSTVENTGRWNPVYMQGISLGGIGQSAINNTISNNPGAGIQTLPQSMMHTIQGNYVNNALKELNDMGAIYISGQCPHCRGTKVVENIIEDAVGYRGNENSEDFSSTGIYADDTVNEVTIQNNIINGSGIGALIGGGQYNTVDKNIIVNSRIADVFIDQRKDPNSWYRSSINGGMTEEQNLLNPTMYASEVWTETFPRMLTYDVNDYRVLGLEITNNFLGSNTPFAFKDGVGGKIISFSINGTIEQYCHPLTPWILCPSFGLNSGESRTILGVSSSLDGTYATDRINNSSFTLRDFNSSSIPSLSGFPIHYKSYISMIRNSLQLAPELNSDYSLRDEESTGSKGIKEISLNSIGASGNSSILFSGEIDAYANESKQVTLLSRFGLTKSQLLSLRGANLPAWATLNQNENSLIISPPISATNQSIPIQISLSGVFEIEKKTITINVHPERLPAETANISLHNGVLSWESVRKYSDGETSNATVKYVVRIYDSQTGELILEALAQGTSILLDSLPISRGKQFFAKVFTYIREGIESSGSSPVNILIPNPDPGSNCAYLDFNCDGVTDIIRYNANNSNYSIEAGVLASTTSDIYSGTVVGSLWGISKDRDGKNKFVSISNRKAKALDPVSKSNSDLSIPSLQGTLPHCIQNGTATHVRIQKLKNTSSIFVNNKKRFQISGNVNQSFCTPGSGITSGLTLRTKDSGVFFIPNIAKKKISRLSKTYKGTDYLFFIPKGLASNEQIYTISKNPSSGNKAVYTHRNSKWSLIKDLPFESINSVYPYQNKLGKSGLLIELEDKSTYAINSDGEITQIQENSNVEDGLMFSMQYKVRK